MDWLLDKDIFEELIDEDVEGVLLLEELIDEDVEGVLLFEELIDEDVEGALLFVVDEDNVSEEEALH